MALRQGARYYQHVLSDNYDLEVRKKGRILLERSVDCDLQSFNDEMHGYMEDQYLRAKVLNTFARTSRYWSNENKVTAKEMAGEHPDYQTPCDNQ